MRRDFRLFRLFRHAAYFMQEVLNCAAMRFCWILLASAAALRPPAALPCRARPVVRGAALQLQLGGLFDAFKSPAELAAAQARKDVDAAERELTDAEEELYAVEQKYKRDLLKFKSPELQAAKKESNFYLRKVEQAKAIDAMEERKRKRQMAEGGEVERPSGKQKKRQRVEDEGGGAPARERLHGDGGRLGEPGIWPACERREDLDLVAQRRNRAVGVLEELRRVVAGPLRHFEEGARHIGAHEFS